MFPINQHLLLNTLLVGTSDAAFHCLISAGVVNARQTFSIGAATVVSTVIFILYSPCPLVAIITGAVMDLSDDSDYFVFTPDQSGNYAIYLCEDTCTQHPTDASVAIQVLDQFGDLIAGNPVGEESTKILTASFDAGVLYYVQILGFDTEGAEYPYKLVIID